MKMSKEEAIDILSNDKLYSVSECIEAQDTLIEYANKRAVKEMPMEDYIQDDIKAITDAYMKKKSDELIAELESRFPEIFFTNLSHTRTFTGNNIRETIKEVLLNE